jgi:DNA (cytosine-5)-methyltransferase 1
MTFTFVDLFAGIGGFHAALTAAGGKCVFASEIDSHAAEIYQSNWGLKPSGDITLIANEKVMEVPAHDVLVGGFPCQPFSKSGHQRGMDESRGTLFWNIARIIEIRRPKIVLLENVRNLAGPRHAHEWNVIIETLRDFGYRISSDPLVVSPHKIHSSYGGRPQVRERIFIAATLNPKKELNTSIDIPDMTEVLLEDPKVSWNLARDLPLESKVEARKKSESSISAQELIWIEAWEDFVATMNNVLGEGKLPGFPLWVDAWKPIDRFRVSKSDPEWKVNFLRKNSLFYTEHMKTLDVWLKRWNNLEDFPASRRKFEWQAQDADSIMSGLLHFRPSGIRVKKSTYTPALVAMTQTPIYAPHKRRLTIREGARLQGFPEWFDFGEQAAPKTFKQLGNAVNVGVVFNVFKALIQRDSDILGSRSKLVKTVLNSESDPTVFLESLRSSHPNSKKATI